MKIALVGNGNVASHLYEALKNKTEVYQVNSRTMENFPKGCDIAVLCVKDDAISEVSEKINELSPVIVHTSGSVSMDVLSPFASHYGVMYPLQTFTKGIEIPYNEIPFFIEASDKETEGKITEIASLISENINFCDSDRRKKLHLASVFACNFTNALFGISFDILKENEFSTDDIKPLIKQTVSKLDILSPKEAQTGPAKRNDIKVMQAHLDLLSNNSDLKEIYRILSSHISGT